MAVDKAQFSGYGLIIRFNKYTNTTPVVTATGIADYIKFVRHDNFPKKVK